MKLPTPLRRNMAKSGCGRGVCGEYERCVADYESRLDADEIASFRLRCPPYTYTKERLHADHCCVEIRCRDLDFRLGSHSLVPESLVIHCVVVKTSFCGRPPTREVWEVTPVEPVPPARRVAPAITKHIGWGYMAAPRKKSGDPYTVTGKCWPCSSDPMDPSEPSDCAKLNDGLVEQYPGSGGYGAFGDNCNAFAGWVEKEVLGTRRLGCGVPYHGGGRYQ